MTLPLTRAAVPLARATSMMRAMSLPPSMARSCTNAFVLSGLMHNARGRPLIGVLIAESGVVMVTGWVRRTAGVDGPDACPVSIRATRQIARRVNAVVVCISLLLL